MQEEHVTRPDSGTFLPQAPQRPLAILRSRVILQYSLALALQEAHMRLFGRAGSWHLIHLPGYFSTIFGI